MAVELRLPQLGENIKSADVVNVMVSVGASVEMGQPVLEVETNKAAVEVPASAAGIVDAIHVAPGDEIEVGQLLMTLRDGGSAGGAVTATQPTARTLAPDSETTTAPQPEQEPKAGSTNTNGPAGPATPGALTVVTPIAETAEKLAQCAVVPTGAPCVPAAPSVRRFARELGVDVAQVSGSGPHRRVSIDDVKRHARERLQQVAARPPDMSVPVYSPLPDFGTWGPVRREKMTPIRRTTAEQLTRCWTTIAHVTQFDRADVTELERLQKQYADKATKAGGKLTMAIMVVRVVASALRMFPKFNASIDMARREVICKDYINIGIAVATERGLLVPVLRDVDKKNMLQIAAEVSAIAARTRDGSIRLEELRGGTFTVTNLGNIGGSYFTPIVNWPEVAILGMGRTRTEPAFEDGVCKPRLFLPLSLSYDHRLIDGADGARFLRWVVDAIEQPLLLALEG